MRISVTVFVILISTYVVNASLLDPVIENVVHHQASKPPPHGVSGIWKKKTIWKPRWVKEWKSAKVMKPVWRKVWSPVQIREWVPIPKPPPSWHSVSTPLAPVKTAHSDNAPLWDPVPYPESQQPPPMPASQPLYHAEDPCGKGECDEPHSLAFNQEQISGIIGSNRYKKTPEYSQSADYSETHLTRLPPGSNNWRPPLEPSRSNFDNNFPEIPPFLIPPRFQAFSDSDFNLQYTNHKENHQPNVQLTRSPGIQLQQTPSGTHQWSPSPAKNSVKGHFITKAPDQPYSFLPPELNTQAKNNTRNEGSLDGEPKGKPGFQTHGAKGSLRPQGERDFIQEAQLVGEYHYSEFDLPMNVTSEVKKAEQKGIQFKSKQTQKVKPPPVGTQEPQKIQPNETVNKQRPTRTEVKQPQVGPVQKQTAASFSGNSTNSFQFQKAVTQEIFPIFKALPNLNLMPIPPNHRFAFHPENKPQERPNRNSSQVSDNQFIQTHSKPTVAPEISLHPLKIDPEKSIFDQNFSFHVVYAKPPGIPTPVPKQVHKPQLAQQNTTESSKASPTETTTQIPVISTSSFASTTETVTESPVFIVTPVNLIKA